MNTDIGAPSVVGDFRRSRSPKRLESLLSVQRSCRRQTVAPRSGERSYDIGNLRGVAQVLRFGGSLCRRLLLLHLLDGFGKLLERLSHFRQLRGDG